MTAFFHLIQQVFSHRQAHRRLQAAADKCLTAAQQRVLDEHLATCTRCRAYADQLRDLEDMLRKTGKFINLRTISKQPALPKELPYRQVASSILSRYRRYLMRKRFVSIAQAFAFVGILAAVMLLLVRSDLSPSVTPASGASTSTLTSNPAASTTSPTKTIHASILVTTSPGMPLRFFTRLVSDWIPAPVSATALADNHRRTTEAARGTEWSTETPVPTATRPLISIAEAEQLAGLTIRTPSCNPFTCTFRGANYDPETGAVELLYEFDEYIPGGFSLYQGRSQLDICDFCSLIGASANVQIVQINVVTGEFVAGLWTSDPGDGQGWVWETYGAVNQLRWQEQDMFYVLVFWFMQVSPDRPDVWRDYIVTVAESLSR